MATGQTEVESVQTTRDGGIVALPDGRFVCWPSSQLGRIVALLVGRLASYMQSLVLFKYLLPQSWIDRKQVTWSIMDMDVRLYRCTSLLSAQ